jgi:hypothetical protein
MASHAPGYRGINTAATLDSFIWTVLSGRFQLVGLNWQTSIGRTQLADLLLFFSHYFLAIIF